MIDVAELRALIRYDQLPLTDIEQIFRALVGYPGEEEIRNPTRADLTGALDAACEALIGDGAALPPQTVAAIARLGGANLTTYAAAAELIKDDPTAWHKALRG